MQKTLTIYVREKATKEGRRFYTYSYVHNSKFYDVKFGKACLSRPNSKGYYDIEVDTKDLSVQEKKTIVNDKEKITNILWIKNLINLKVNEEKNAELEAKKLAKINELFD